MGRSSTRNAAFSRRPVRCGRRFAARSINSLNSSTVTESHLAPIGFGVRLATEVLTVSQARQSAAVRFQCAGDQRGPRGPRIGQQDEATVVPDPAPTPV